MKDNIEKHLQRAREIAEQEERAERDRRIEKTARRLAAEEDRERLLARLAELGQTANLEAFRAKLKPEVDAIVKLVLQIVPHLQSAEAKWRANSLLVHEAWTLADDLEVSCPTARELPLMYAKNTVARAIATALADADIDVELARHLDDWLRPKAEDVIVRIRQNRGID
jgi:hypothetical protein